MRAQLRNASMRAIVAMALATAGLVTVPSAQTVVRYTVQDLDLGQLGGDGSSASAINDSGVIVGYLATPLRDSRAARTRPEGIFELLPGLETVSSDAEGVNALGDIAGSFQFSAYPNWAYHAMRYTRDGSVEDLGTLGGPSSFGYRINRSGQVSGWSYVSVTPFVIRGFIATPGQRLQNLGTFSGATYASSFAGGINDAGQVAGHAETSNGRWHAFRYVPGVGLQDIGTALFDNSFASDINAAGQVVGRVISPAGEHAFRYTDGVGMQDVHALGTTSGAASLNDRGDVVGYFYSTGQPSRAFLYTDSDGMVDLNARIDPASGWVLSAAFGINAAGEIVGQGLYQNHQRAFKLTPIPPDTTPPTIRSSASNPALLWPPNASMWDVQVSVDATDNVDPTPHCAISGVSSSEPTQKGDMVVTGGLSLQLRAERDGSGPGRVYSVNVACSDSSGNQATAVVSVRVPHDRE
jgi:probable HAF family extracellular repeat protein